MMTTTTVKVTRVIRVTSSTGFFNVANHSAVAPFQPANSESGFFVLVNCHQFCRASINCVPARGQDQHMLREHCSLISVGQDTIWVL